MLVSGRVRLKGRAFFWGEMERSNKDVSKSDKFWEDITSQMLKLFRNMFKNYGKTMGRFAQEDQHQDTTAKLQGSCWMFLTGFLYVSVLSRLVSY